MKAKKRQKDNLLRGPGIEPGAHRWQRWILPLNQPRLNNAFVLCLMEGDPYYLYIKIIILVVGIKGRPSSYPLHCLPLHDQMIAAFLAA
jgi:hypothetical protein